ncbi:carbohydrate ABC transporter permease [Mahella australiensis]|uniref:Carbohydrate ABC transporter membrane protein 1, CUT1 family n=1 Tax=Mahella australiensis (strain DSM 15567 / CIP 107919 / 50-1 BON) TaxID=697281 RepID=F3ZVZ0_MAHA5|nr:sugar ABC transporter permease [Mahella australiensis]AEE95364.1 carbohydrate ABC transporter membrane protein 1, CUT1 family [Mahella australiensis 50-1 BON]
MKVKKSLIYSDGFWACLLLLPNLLGFIIFTLFPVIAALFLSFTEYDMMSPVKWIGIQNYTELFNDATFKQVLFNTLYYSIFTVPLGVIISLFLAIALDQKIALVKFYRAVYFLPVISSMVAVAMVWQWIFNPEYGLLNYILSLFRIKGPAWLSDPTWAMPAIIITNIWKGLGFNMLLFLAGLQGISNSYYEAADIEGASWWTKFIKITIPLLSPTTFFVLIMSFISSFQVFDSVFLMTGGGPGRSTSVLVHYLYQNAFQYFRMGYASALAYVLFLLVFLVTIVQFIFQKKWVVY